MEQSPTSMVSSHLQTSHLPTKQLLFLSLEWKPKNNHQAGNENCYDFNNRSDGRSFGSCLWYCKKNQLLQDLQKMIHTEQITKRPVTNVIESLSGQVAGLQMTMTNGQPGETPSILIRGISS